MTILTKEQIIMLHSELIRTSGGIDGVLDEGLLDAAVHAPFQSYDQIDAYPSIQQKAARLGYGLVKNHPFADGNKRIGAHAMLTFLLLNRIELEYTQVELSDIFLKIAADEAGYNEMLLWIVMHQT